MSDIALKISEQTNNFIFNLTSIKEFIALLNNQKKEYTDLTYKANGSCAFLIKATKNGLTQVALKVMKWNGQGSDIERIKLYHANLKYLTCSNYFLAVQDQFFLGQQHDDVEQNPNESSKLNENGYFVQELELCQGSLRDILQESEKKGSITESLKEALAIQILDITNLLTQRQIIHGNIQIQNFLVSSSQHSQIQLKLNNLSFNLKSPMKQELAKDNLQSIFSQNNIDISSIESKRVSLGITLLELDNIGKFSIEKISRFDLDQIQEGKIFENHQINRSSVIHKIACILLDKFNANTSTWCITIRQVLLLLHNRSPEHMKIPLFSMILKSQVEMINMQIQPSLRNQQPDYLRQVSKQSKLKNLMEFLNANKSSSINHLTPELLKSALTIMLQWEEFSEEYDIINVGANNAVFGVTNLFHNRQSILKLSLCTNKAETIREIGVMRICQTPFIVKFYGYRFFKDSNNNEFVVYELERCIHSLSNHLKQQRIAGVQYSYQQKQHLIIQIIDSVNFLHMNNILHRNINLENFLISEDELGQPIVKLSNFSHAGYLQDKSWLDVDLDGSNGQLNNCSHFNCIISQHKRESPLYFSPEKMQNPNATTIHSEIFSVGLCILLLESYLVFSEDQLAEKFTLFIDQNVDIYQEKGITGKADTGIICSVAKQFLSYFPKQRKSLSDYIEKCNESCSVFSKVSALNTYQYYNQNQTCLHLNTKYDAQNFLNLLSTVPSKVDFTRLSTISLILFNCQIRDTQASSLLSGFSEFINLSSLSLNLDTNQISDIGAGVLLSPLAVITNLSRLSINLSENEIGDIGAKSLLVPLSQLKNISSFSFAITENQIGALGAEHLLCPLADLINLTSLSLSLWKNTLGVNGAKSLLVPISNLLNLSDFSLDIYDCSIRDIGAQNLLLPLANLFNLVSISLDLSENFIGQRGAESILSPLANLINLSNLSLNFSHNSIQEIGAQSLLSPLANLINLFNISLNVQQNQLRDIGAKYILSPVVNLINLQSIFLNVGSNFIEEIGAKYLLTHLANLHNLTNISLEIQDNPIGTEGGQNLLFPLDKLINLSRISLMFWGNSIGLSGTNSLLSPLKNLKNLFSISIELMNNKIEDIGVEGLLNPLVDLMNLQELSLNLCDNLIGDVGVLVLLSKLAGLSNLSSLELTINTQNKIFKHLVKQVIKHQRI